MPLTKIVTGVIADATITTADIATGTIVSADIDDGTIVSADMALDPRNASNLSSGDVPLAQLGNVPATDLTGLQDDIALLAFKTQANGSLARYNLVDQSVDAFEDASGVDASASTNEVRESTNYWWGATTTTPTVTGGTITTDGDYKVHTFTANGDFISDALWSGSQGLDYVIVAGGGGGGGRMGGGGGAGGFRYLTGQTVTAATHAVVIGAGGAGGNNTQQGTNGVDSTFNSATANGGGGGARESGSPGGAGGSGGGGSYVHPSGDPGGGIWGWGAGNEGGFSPVEGYRGGAGGNPGGYYGGGGGGGASAAAVDMYNTDTNTAGSGGAGAVTTISGTSETYGGGGGGGIRTSGTAGAGGAGGGGQGATSTGGTGTAGTANTGGGGGGGGGEGGIGATGGSGIVIIRRPTLHYVAADLTLVSNTLTAASAVTKGDMVMTYTNNAGTATLNTDLKGYISRDNGSNYTELTLASQGTTGGHTILTAHDVTLGGTDTSQMRWKVTTHNQVAGTKETFIQAVSLGWS